MKTFGIILFVFASLNLIVAFIAAASGDAEATGSKILATMLLGFVGGVCYYFGNKKKATSKTETKASALSDYSQADNNKESPTPKQQLKEKQEVWEQFGKITGKRVITTGHLLLLQQFVTDTLFIYNHPSNKTNTPSFMWKKELYLGDNSMIGCSLPFIWLKSMSANDVETFNKSIDVINNEFGKEISQIGIDQMLQGIRTNGFIDFKPNFDVIVNRRLIETLWRDSVCLKKFLTFFGGNVDWLEATLPGGDDVTISVGSTDFRNLVSIIISDVRNGNIKLNK